MVGALGKKKGKQILTLSFTLIAVIAAFSHPDMSSFLQVANAASGSTSIAPTTFWGPFIGTSGDVQIDIDRKGIAVRVEIPREFLAGIISAENETHFIKSDITNDYYYYILVDESNHWSYSRNGTNSDAPCFKPKFSIYDPNAPWCAEIWNYQNGTFLTFTPPKFIRFLNLRAPEIAGLYNFTLFVADHTNNLGLPDFINAFSKTLTVPVSMSDNPARIVGTICDDDDHSDTCPPILAKGVAYARNIDTNQISRAYVSQTTGLFNLTGLAPGNYEVRASAGVFRGVAFSLSDPVSILNVVRGDVRSAGSIHLKRAPQVCGTIKYDNSRDPAQPNFLARSLTDHPYLRTVGFRILNITVEAMDPQGHVFRYQNASRDRDSDNFKIITGTGVKYVGLDPYGTEFSGLPQPNTFGYQMIINVWISGYLQRESETATITTGPGRIRPIPCNQVAPNPLVMETGGVISGTLQFRNLVDVETPHQAELSLEVAPPTDALFGGNFVVEVFGHDSVLQGVTIVNGTRADGKTIFANSVSVRFYVIGFSEVLNRTWSGVWGRKDYGLPEDIGGYRLSVSLRGYEQSTKSPISLSRGGNSTVTVTMTRGGAILVKVTSFNNRPGTRMLQAEKPFRFLNLSIPVKARIYFYDSAGRLVGFEERSLVQGLRGIGQTSFTVLFAGQNWSLREIWYFGFEPTHITNDTYTVKGFTLGYIQPQDVTTFGDLASLSQVFLPLLIGNEIDVTAPIFAEPNLFWRIPEHDHVIAQASSGGVLAGAVPANLTAGVRTLSLPIFGFGGMVLKGKFTGQGHFFYVSPDGTRYFDYGLDTDIYTTEIPEFGFNKHFTQIESPVTITFDDLAQGQGVILDLVAMGRIIHGTRPNSLVAGWIAGIIAGNQTVPLSWVRVEAANASFTRSVPTLDGRYDGTGALHLPAGVYSVTFSVSFYQPQTQTDMGVPWNGTLSLLPPEGPLCPLADPTACTSPLPAPSFSYVSLSGDTVLADARHEPPTRRSQLW